MVETHHEEVHEESYEDEVRPRRGSFGWVWALILLLLLLIFGWWFLATFGGRDNKNNTNQQQQENVEPVPTAPY